MDNYFGVGVGGAPEILGYTEQWKHAKFRMFVQRSERRKSEGAQY